MGIACRNKKGQFVKGNKSHLGFKYVSDSVQREKKLLYAREYMRAKREASPEAREFYVQQCREWRAKNREKARVAVRRWYKENREKAIQGSMRRFKVRVKTEPILRIKTTLRTRLYYLLKDCKGSKTKWIEAFLGCKLEDLKLHIEAQFKPGMAWSNHSLHGWHIDHVKPLSSFDLNNKEEAKLACHYTNLQPLWAKENLLKSNK